MRKVLLIFAVFFSLSIFVSAQRHNSRDSRILVDAKKPAVFLSFLRMSEIISEGKKEKYFFFRITNNTRWYIWLDMSGVPKEFGDTKLYYMIEDKKTGAIRDGSKFCHVCSVNKLRPGGSIIFSLPSSSASYDALLRIKYVFDWERNRASADGSFSTHSAAFDFYSLPKTVKTSEGW